MSNQDLCGAWKVFHKEFACRETCGHGTDGDEPWEGGFGGAGEEQGMMLWKAERGEEKEECRGAQGSSFGACMCVHP